MEFGAFDWGVVGVQLSLLLDRVSLRISKKLFGFVFDVGEARLPVFDYVLSSI